MAGKTPIAGLFSNTLFYIVAAFLQSGVSFILIPFYTRAMSKAEFGAMDQIGQAVVLLCLVGNLGLPLGLARGFYLENNDDKGRRKLVGTLFSFIGLLTFGISGILICFKPQLSKLLFGNTYRTEWFSFGILVFILSTFQQIPLLVLRTLEKAGLSTMWSLALFIVNACTTVIFVVVLHRGLTGMLCAYCISYGMIMILQFTWFGRYCSLNFEFKRLAPLFAFGLPMLPNMAARNILETANRYILPHYHGLAELATLTMAAKISSIINAMLLMPFIFACVPFIYSHAHDPKSPKMFGRLTYYMSIVLCILFLAIEAFKKPLLAFLGGSQYSDSGPVITVVMIGVVLSGLQNVVSAGIHISKKIPQESAIMVIASLVSVACNFLLIPHFKSLGAASAVTIGFFIFLAGTFWLSQKHYPVPYPYKKIASTLVFVLIARIGLQLTGNEFIHAAIVGAFVLMLTVIDRSLVRDVRSLFVQIIAERNAKPALPPADVPNPTLGAD